MSAVASCLSCLKAPSSQNSVCRSLFREWTWMFVSVRSGLLDACGVQLCLSESRRFAGEKLAHWLHTGLGKLLWGGVLCGYPQLCLISAWPHGQLPISLCLPLSNLGLSCFSCLKQSILSSFSSCGEVLGLFHLNVSSPRVLLGIHLKEWMLSSI